MSRKYLLVVGWVAAGSLPFVLGSTLPTRAIAWVFYFALAGIGLNLVMGLGNMASIGHGAFVAVGALTAAQLRTRWSISFIVAVVVATLATALAAWLVGYGAVRLRAVKFAVSSWLGAWLMTLFLVSFPAISGGSGGIVIPEATVGGAVGATLTVTPTAHYEIALVLLALGLILFRSVQLGSIGLTLATIKQNPREAVAIGTLRDGVRLKVFVLGAILAGLAGGLGVQLSGLFDPGGFGVLLSVSLFVAVMLGGPGKLWAPVVGAAVVAVLPLSGQPLIPLFTTARTAGELLAGGLLLGVVAVRARRPVTRAPEKTALEPTGEDDAASDLPPVGLVVRGVTKRFGGLVALQDVDLEVGAGTVHGIMGPNGSGKSTLLAIISGHLFPTGGTVSLGGKAITHLPATERLRLGIARSLQSTELFPDMTALEHLVAASLVDRAFGGLVRTAMRTPLARAEERQAVVDAARLLDDFGLTGYSTTPARSIPAGARRTLMMAVAVAGRRVILLDEPSTGMSPAEIRRAAGMILELKDRGAALVVVEHNMRLLRSVADTITVLDGGRVIAHGEPSHIYEHPEVRLAYLGRTEGGRS
ncbi:MAG: branched-chain amino acid transport system ATP-binding protein livM [Actinomycetota bacterium]|jgi:ABC-type branched-subunit amino acid transport system ATPase component/ABC-type branched-subunit amino acid transport system permease subunit|nr:branched-chain amino acid transport system ATP-binding protein livM [Actinomycetota bacterium]